MRARGAMCCGRFPRAKVASSAGYSFTRNFAREMTAAVVDGRISCISCETTIDRRGRRTARRWVGEDYKRARRLLVKSDRRGK